MHDLPLKTSRAAPTQQTHEKAPGAGVGTPRVTTPSRLPTAQFPRPGSEPPTRVKVLIVEDEAIIALAIESALSRNGYEVLGIADSAAAALVMIELAPPSAILMDISIRGAMGGIDLAAEITSRMDVPIVFLTAYGDGATLARVTKVSPYGYIIKPYDERSLIVTLGIAVERHRADARLRLLHQAISAAEVGILLVEVQGTERRIDFANDAFLAMSGASREQAMGRRPCFLAAHPESAEVLRLKDAVESLGPARETILGRRADGSDFWSTVSITPVADRSGQVGHLLVFHIDISREREVAHHATMTQRFEVAGRLASELAHDFEAVFGAILSFSVLAHASTTHDTMRTDLEQISNAVRRGVALAHKLSRLVEPDSEPGPSTSDVGQVVTDARHLLERAGGQAIRVLLDCSPQSMLVSIETSALEQILLNLVLNARDSMPAGGAVIIRAACPNVPSERFCASQYVRIEVSCVGGGVVSDGTTAPLFETRFAKETREDGSGLEMVTSRRLVEEVGGTIAFGSTDGVFSSVLVELPRLAWDERKAISLRQVLPLEQANGATCLVVESDPQIRLASVRTLRAIGFEVFEAPGVGAALGQLDALGTKLDIIITGSRLAGAGACREVLDRARSRSPGVGLLVLTSHLEDSLGQFGPGVEFLWRPFTPAALSRRALDLLGRRPAPAEPGPRLAQAPTPEVPKAAEPRPPRTRPTLLLVEPADEVARDIQSQLRVLDLEVVRVSTTGALYAAMASRQFDAAIVDLGSDGATDTHFVRELLKRDQLVPVIATAVDMTYETFQRALESRVISLLPKPVLADELVRAVQQASAEGQVRRLQQRLNAMKAGAVSSQEDLEATERRFAECIAGLFMLYQPIVHPDGRAFGYEALLRSRGPCDGPLDLIGMAERLGRVEELGRVARASIAATLTFNPDRTEPIFVNVHPHELRGGWLNRSDEPLLPWASRIIIEITERAQLGPASEVSANIDSLRAKGFRLAVDDVGEGYAGLSWLIKLEPDITKIDMSLIRGIESSPMKRDIVASLVNLGRRSNAFVVAEGIETEAEAETVRDLGCDLLQGYLFGRPGQPFPAAQLASPRGAARV